MSRSCRYRFGAFELRAQTRELYKHGVKLKLRPQAYQVLALLLEQPGNAFRGKSCRSASGLRTPLWILRMG